MDLLRTKPVEDVIAQVEAGSSETGGVREDGQGRLRKRLGPVDLIGFGVGIVIGTGIFTLTGVEAKNHAGPAVMISFVVAGVVAVLAALCYAELASAVPTAGSAYTYAYATVGELVAWIIGWDLILEFTLGASVVSRGWSGYLGNLLDLPTSLFGEKSVGQRRRDGHRARARHRRCRRHPRVGVRHQRAGDDQGRDLRLHRRGRPVLHQAAQPHTRSSRPRSPSRPATSGLSSRSRTCLRASRRRRSASPASSPPRRSSSSPTPVSRPSRTSARRPATRPGTCRSASSARSPSRPCSTSASRSSSSG